MTVDSGAARTIGIIGGTGPQGRGLATRWAVAGVQVTLGSRDAARAADVAAEVGHGVTGASNEDAAAADVVVVTVPFDAHEATLRSLEPVLRGRIVVDSVNPLGFDKQGPFALAVPEGSAAQQAEVLLPGSTVLAAFHHVSAVSLADLSVTDLALDVLVLGDDRDAVDVVVGLADLMPGVRGLYGGRLRNAHQVEALTANLIAINRRYKAHAGLRITDV
ncbi:NADPH-dependent F420 reductase [Solicola sp. PLA-1-18]|uniref:NADPH-dependent F420 reductase n=1 Tax=Solicola sp. PLA-1-18 TaxID=3380532 RepID=UPI003B7ACE92